MNKFVVWANSVFFGVYEGCSEIDAINKCVQDAGYASIQDMENRLDTECEIQARKIEHSVAQAE
jgi:hypothetical protein